MQQPNVAAARSGPFSIKSAAERPTSAGAHFQYLLYVASTGRGARHAGNARAESCPPLIFGKTQPMESFYSLSLSLTSLTLSLSLSAAPCHPRSFIIVVFIFREYSTLRSFCFLLHWAVATHPCLKCMLWPPGTVSIQNFEKCLAEPLEHWANTSVAFQLNHPRALPSQYLHTNLHHAYIEHNQCIGTSTFRLHPMRSWKSSSKRDIGIHQIRKARPGFHSEFKFSR